MGICGSAGLSSAGAFEDGIELRFWNASETVLATMILQPSQRTQDGRLRTFETTESNPDTCSDAR